MTFLLIFITMLYFSSSAYADSTDKAQEQELTIEQKREIAKIAGIMVSGNGPEEEQRKTHKESSTNNSMTWITERTKKSLK